MLGSMMPDPQLPTRYSSGCGERRQVVAIGGGGCLQCGCLCCWLRPLRLVVVWLLLIYSVGARGALVPTVDKLDTCGWRPAQGRGHVLSMVSGTGSEAHQIGLPLW